MENSWSIWSVCENELFKSFLTEFKTAPVVMCLGSSQIVEDCLGPMIGSFLKRHGYKNHVYGSLNANINAKNLKMAQNFVHAMHQGQKLLVIDASTTTNTERLGQIVLKTNYVPFNSNLKNTKLDANWFLFGVCSVCESLFPQMFYAKKLLIKKLAKKIANCLLKLPA